jgi:hypothetical protein
MANAFKNMAFIWHPFFHEKQYKIKRRRGENFSKLFSLLLENFHLFWNTLVGLGAPGKSVSGKSVSIGNKWP